MPPRALRVSSFRAGIQYGAPRTDAPAPSLRDTWAGVASGFPPNCQSVGVQASRPSNACGFGKTRPGTLPWSVAVQATSRTSAACSPFAALASASLTLPAASTAAT
ncbi:MAG: hypothetical protein QM704_05290 [Anaeromyxobacteraceae bacterium]